MRDAYSILSRHAHLGRDVPHAADDDLQNGAAVSAQQVDFVDEEQANLLGMVGWEGQKRCSRRGMQLRAKGDAAPT